MSIRLRKPRPSPQLEQAPRDLADPGAAVVPGERLVRHRRFLKTLGAAMGLAGASQVLAGPRVAAAAFVPGAPNDVVNNNLVVQGFLGVALPSAASPPAFPWT